MGTAFREFVSMTGTWANLVASLRSWGSRVRGEAELRKRKAAKLPSESRPCHHFFQLLTARETFFRMDLVSILYFDLSWPVRHRLEPEYRYRH